MLRRTYSDGLPRSSSMPRWLCHAHVHAPQRVREALAHVAEQQLRLRVTVEDLPEDDAHGVRTGIDSPAPHRADEFFVTLEDVRYVHADGGVQIERHVESHRPLPHDVKVGVVEVLPLCVRVDEAATEAILLHGAFELVRCRLRVLQGKRRKATEMGWVLVDHGLEEVVDLERIGNGNPGVLLRLDAGGRERQHLHVKAVLVHLGNAQFEEVGEATSRVLPGTGAGYVLCARAVTEHLRHHEVFFESNGFHVSSPRIGYSAVNVFGLCPITSGMTITSIFGYPGAFAFAFINTRDSGHSRPSHHPLSSSALTVGPPEGAAAVMASPRPTACAPRSQGISPWRDNGLDNRGRRSCRRGHAPAARACAAAGFRSGRIQGRLARRPTVQLQ